MDQLKTRNHLMLLGLTPLEQEVYLSASTLGGSPLCDLALQVNMSLEEIEPIVNSLTRRGIGYFTKSKKDLIFWVASPDELEEMVKQKEAEIGAPR